jgi:hypothetical protein
MRLGPLLPHPAKRAPCRWPTRLRDCATPTDHSRGGSGSGCARAAVGRSRSTAPNPVGTGTDGVRTYSDRTQAAVLAAHYAETTQRARRAMVELVRAGYQIGPAPYGYRTLRIRVTDSTGHGRFRVVLVPDWHTAAVVTQIFYWRADQGLGFRAIARRLNTEPRRYPSRPGTDRGIPVPSGASSPTRATPDAKSGPAPWPANRSRSSSGSPRRRWSTSR